MVEQMEIGMMTRHVIMDKQMMVVHRWVRQFIKENVSDGEEHLLRGSQLYNDTFGVILHKARNDHRPFYNSVRNEMAWIDALPLKTYRLYENNYRSASPV